MNLARQRLQYRRVQSGVLYRLAGAAPAALSELEVAVTFATSALALDGDIWVIEGMDLTHFLEHPAVLRDHDMSKQVGRASDVIKTATEARARVTFAPPGVSAVADETRGLVKAKIMTGVSACIIPLESELIDPARPWKGRRITRSILVEFSFCASPSDAGSRVTARSTGAAEGLAVAQPAPLRRFEALDRRRIEVYGMGEDL